MHSYYIHVIIHTIMKKKIIPFFFFLCLCTISLPHHLHAQSVHVTSQEEKKLFDHLTIISHMIQEKDTHRISHIKAVNQSYKKLQKAITLFAQKDTHDTVVTLLKNAKKNHKENFFVSLFLGSYLYKENALAEAAPYFMEFIQKSPFPTSIERTVIPYHEIMETRQIVMDILQQEGYTIPPLTMPLSYKLQKSLNRLNAFPNESRIGVILTIIVGVGLVWIIIHSMICRADPEAGNTQGKRFCIQTYYIFLIGYLIWMIHLYLGIPPIIAKTLEKEIISVLIIGIFVISIGAIAELIEKKKRIKDNPNIILCPHCKKPQQRLAAICAHCRKPIPEKK